MNFRVFIVLALFFQCINNFANYKTHVKKETIHALQIFKAGWPLSNPVINFQSSEQIEICFDELDASNKNYQYSLVHCNADFSKSTLSKMEYVQGLADAYINDFQYSFNTNIQYVHYTLRLPNEETRITKPGNYALIVYEDNNLAKIVCVACFCVVDFKVDMVATVSFDTQIDIRNKHQQVNFSINHKNYVINDPHRDLKIYVRQNNRLDNQVTEIEPTFVKPGLLIYENNRKLAFKGGNEYRHFDVASLRYNSQGIRDIVKQGDFCHVEMHNDELFENKRYLSDREQNGKFFIRNQEVEDDRANLESDYVYVHFNLPMPSPLFTKNIYIGGGFTNTIFDDKTKMEYDFDTKSYKKSWLLKQGYYNYRYFVVDNKTGETTSQPVEEDYYETENEYEIFIYHRPISARFDIPIGYTVVKSRNL